MNKFTWLFGENEGKTMNNNSFYFWQHITSKSSEIESYFVVAKNSQNTLKIQKLSPELQKSVVFKNSKKHIQIYQKSDMFFVTLSYKDITPLPYFQLARRIKKPIIYLQHGTLGIKKISYTGKSYWNNMFRFLTYNPLIKERMINEHGFKDYQIHFAAVHPRYKKLVELNKAEHEKKQIFWFITWREQLKSEMNQLVGQILRIGNNADLRQHLETKNKSLKICLHPFFPKNIHKSIQAELISERVKIAHADQIEVIEEIANSCSLITDYSSLGFDFTFLKKPVYIYQFDQESYVQGRDVYCDVASEFANINCKNPGDLITKISAEESMLNSFFAERLPSTLDLEAVKKGVYIDQLYQTFSQIQKSMVSIMIFNEDSREYGIRVARILLERGYLIEMLVLSGSWLESYPPGLNVSFIFKNHSVNPLDELKQMLFSKNKNFIDEKVKQFFKTSKSKTVLLNAEEYYPIIHQAKSDQKRTQILCKRLSNEELYELFPQILGGIG